VSDAKVLHEWENNRFCYRVLGGSVPRVERGGAEAGVRVFAGVVVCNNAETVNELARLAARVRALEAAVRWVAHTVPRPDRKLDPVYQEAKFRMHVWLADHPIVREVIEKREREEEK